MLVTGYSPKCTLRIRRAISSPIRRVQLNLSEQINLCVLLGKLGKRSVFRGRQYASPWGKPIGSRNWHVPFPEKSRPSNPQTIAVNPAGQVGREPSRRASFTYIPCSGTRPMTHPEEFGEIIFENPRAGRWCVKDVREWSFGAQATTW